MVNQKKKVIGRDCWLERPIGQPWRKRARRKLDHELEERSQNVVENKGKAQEMMDAEF